MLNFLLMFLMVAMAIFLILLVLVQRGRGGGLAGALGGMGGQSAFGTKAGDVFTKVTIVTAVFWILLLIAAARHFGSSSGDNFDSSLGSAAQTNATKQPEGSSAPADSKATTAVPDGSSDAKSTAPSGDTKAATETKPAETKPAEKK